TTELRKIAAHWFQPHPWPRAKLRHRRFRARSGCPVDHKCRDSIRGHHPPNDSDNSPGQDPENPIVHRRRWRRLLAQRLGLLADFPSASTLRSYRSAASSYHLRHQHVVERIDGSEVALRQPAAVEIHGDLNARVTHLLAHVVGRLALLEQ